MTEAQSQTLKPGQIFAGRYRIERFLAQGGYGAVFAAEQLATEAAVAIKVLRPHMIESEDALRRFEFEAKVAGRVRSEFIVRVLDAGVDEATSTPYLVMELLEGSSLAEHVKGNGPLSAADTAFYLMQVAQGLDKAHRYTNKDGVVQPIVHRDLKPENLFVTTRDDGRRLVKILDFGIAKVISDSLVASQGIRGTPLYMAYEQLTGGRISPATDVWALGLIAFFLLTGRSYWRSADPAEPTLAAVFAEVLSGPIVKPNVRARELGLEPNWAPEFDVWFQRCVNRVPESRFSSAGEAASKLQEALLGCGLSDTLPESSAPLVAAGLSRSRDAGTSAASEDHALYATQQPREVSDAATKKYVAPLALVAGALLVVAAVWHVGGREEELRTQNEAQQSSATPRPPEAKPILENSVSEPGAGGPSASAEAPVASASSSALAPSSLVRKQAPPPPAARSKGLPERGVKPAASSAPAPWVYDER